MHTKGSAPQAPSEPATRTPAWWCLGPGGHVLPDPPGTPSPGIRDLPVSPRPQDSSPSGHPSARLLSIGPGIWDRGMSGGAGGGSGLGGIRGPDLRCLGEGWGEEQTRGLTMPLTPHVFRISRIQFPASFPKWQRELVGWRARSPAAVGTCSSPGLCAQQVMGREGMAPPVRVHVQSRGGVRALARPGLGGGPPSAPAWSSPSRAPCCSR